MKERLHHLRVSAFQMREHQLVADESMTVCHPTGLTLHCAVVVRKNQIRCQRLPVNTPGAARRESVSRAQ